MSTLKQNSIGYSTDVKLSPKTLIAYVFGQGFHNFFHYLVFAYLTVYLSDYVGIPMLAISPLLLFVRIFDGVIDPFLGGMMDASKGTRMGRFRPWVVTGAAITSVAGILLFSINPSWSESFKIGWMWIFYVIYTVFYSIYTMAERGMFSVLTSNAYERTKASSLKTILSSIASTIPGYYMMALLMLMGNGTADASAFTKTAALLSIIVGVVCVLSPILVGQEVIKKAPQSKGEKDNRSVLVKLKMIVSSKYAIIALAGYFIFGLFVQGRATFCLYWCQYVLGDYNMFATQSLVSMFAGVIGPAVMMPFFKKWKNKGVCCQIGLGVAIITYLFCFFLPGGNKVVGAVVSGLSILGSALFSTAVVALFPDIADFVEWKHGERMDGTINAMGSMAYTLGGAITPAIGTAWLGVTGYVANAQQNAATIQAIRMNTWLLPAVFAAICFITMFFYDLDKKHPQIIKELDTRRASAKGSAE